MLIKEIMTRDIESVQINDSILLAAKKMKSQDVGCIPVLDGDKPVGIITDRDIVLRVVSEQLNPMETIAEQIMSRDVRTLSEDADVQDAVDLMVKEQIRRLPIVNQHGKMTGVLSVGDLSQNLEEHQAGEILREVSKPVVQFR